MLHHLIKHLETIKALGLPPLAFISFSVFGTSDEILALVVILHETLHLMFDRLLKYLALEYCSVGKSAFKRCFIEDHCIFHIISLQIDEVK